MSLEASGPRQCIKGSGKTLRIPEAMLTRLQRLETRDCWPFLLAPLLTDITTSMSSFVPYVCSVCCYNSTTWSQWAAAEQVEHLPLCPWAMQLLLHLCFQQPISINDLRVHVPLHTPNFRHSRLYMCMNKLGMQIVHVGRVGFKSQRESWGVKWSCVRFWVWQPLSESFCCQSSSNIPTKAC